MMLQTIKWMGRDVAVQCSMDQSQSYLRGNCRISELLETAITGPEKIRISITFKVNAQNKTGACALTARLGMLATAVKVEEAAADLSAGFFVQARNKLLRALLESIQKELDQLEMHVMNIDLDDQLLVRRQPGQPGAQPQNDIQPVHAAPVIHSSRQSYLPGYLPAAAPRSKPASGSYLPAVKTSFARNGYLNNGYEHNGNGHGNAVSHAVKAPVEIAELNHAVHDIACRMLQLKDVFRAIERTVQ
jgi:hypothetical protein